ncbi:heavy-metal-associated domain-containing protein [Billgrantia diversa]|uniref:heavy-metal-associated domain-containing protein n=1 Tax=Halomonas sp. MCCC 1A13316 TaxID=2733487 RepID=UPI0018A52C39|nr:heavy-metal-associated domain-containing protein [Halomonas sp. MCCC 1A13316]QOR39647.1 heavy-metal-associated domain-containing protein [Halomonas sp. MCCC 1A13316]
MLKLNVPDMSCNHCVSAISAAIESVDNDASMEFDLAHRQVNVESNAPIEAIKAAVEEAGYPNQVA